MDREDALSTFVTLTGANGQVAGHLLDSFGGDLDSAINFYLESGGVGYGGPPVPASPPDYVEEPDVIEEEPGPVAARSRSRPLPAAARPRSSPIEILDDDDDDIQVLATSLGRRRSSRAEEVVEEDRMHPVGSVEDDLGVGSQGRRVRRNRRRVVGEMDRDLELLGQRFGVMAEFQPAPTMQQQQLQQQQQPGPGQDPAAFGGDGEVPELPADVNLEEQRMLMAAIQGGGYEGEIPDFAHDPRYQPRIMSPGAQAREDLRQEQDAAYYESLRADREKQEAAERAQREVEEAARLEAEAAEAEERRQREEAERLEHELRSKAASLPPEPAADDADAVNLAIRLPAGGRYSRRFRRADKLQSVFDFVDVQSGAGGGDILPGSYSLATSYPRRVLEDGAAEQSLAEAGLSAKQEALFLEMK
ncbi:hypothetical protein CHLNCDRAFT_133523 [Chlorella variabilis]|uniref:UBX domain-containing protein n=1 Tax=Chlorella variabilis TaxID=554065 RepID=E1Z398_CHLVA|nr:hypothetical protein CHLNCDRAFT_133523 [Chlorella variabilis]EFN59802.1 hypothetical protein CHLNCDRAFT_133523 [Chlorella variabilis]|eukprot:XP_005851904.1 hypothetical protein CHLNCDRAFT_133523 [Chlorella variabilis]